MGLCYPISCVNYSSNGMTSDGLYASGIIQHICKLYHTMPNHTSDLHCILYEMFHFLSQLVEVNVLGCNVWVMKEAGGPASDLPPLGHLQQKVHAQQSVASSKDRPTLYEQDIMSLRIAGMYVHA